jgi:hypothetical protein
LPKAERLAPIQALPAAALPALPVEAPALPAFETRSAPVAVAETAPAPPATTPISPSSSAAASAGRVVAEPRSQVPGGPAGLTANPPSATGRPDAGASVGHDVATAPSLPASAPRLLLDLVPRRGGAISAQGSRGLLPLLPHPPETKSKLAQDIEKAAKTDCRQAYAGMGLLAAVPLAVDALRDKGCRW